MAGRTIVVDGETWEVAPAGRVTVYDRDQFGVVFEQGTGPERRRRFTRYAPVGSRSTDASLAELSDRQLIDLLRQRSEEHTSELQSLRHLVCRLLLEKKKNKTHIMSYTTHHTHSTTTM